MLNTQKEIKALAKGLRREVLARKSFEALSEMSHTQWLSLLAKSVGFESWNALEAHLPKVPPQGSQDTQDISSSSQGALYDFKLPESSRFLLLDGRSFCLIEGELDTVPGLAYVQAAKGRQGEKIVGIEWGGETEMDWDGQVPRRTSEGEVQWHSETGNLVKNRYVVLCPEELKDALDELDADADETTRAALIRPGLVQMYKSWIREHAAKGTSFEAMKDLAWAAIEFKLTAVEEVELQRLLTD